MDFKLELVAVPVSDVDRAKAFYVDQVGFVLDHDHTVDENLRFIQLTPPGPPAPGSRSLLPRNRCRRATGAGRRSGSGSTAGGRWSERSAPRAAGASRRSATRRTPPRG